MLEASRSTVLIFLLTVITHSQTDDSFNKILGLASKNNKPLVLYLGVGQKKGGFIDLLVADDDEKKRNSAEQSSSLDDLLLGQRDKEDDEELTLEEKAKNQAKYLLFNFLRTSPDNLDPQLEKRKQVLRQALRARCKKVTTCVKICTESYYEEETCPTKCKKKLDNDDLCNPPPKCNHCSSGGKTMPPKWLLF